MLKARISTTRKQPARVMTDAEIKVFWSAASEVPGGAALKDLLLSALRPSTALELNDCEMSALKSKVDKRMREELSDLQPGRLHTLRSTAHSLMDRAGISPQDRRAGTPKGLKALAAEVEKIVGR